MVTDRDILRSIAKLAVKHRRKNLYLWCVRQNQRSLLRQWEKEKNAASTASR